MKVKVYYTKPMEKIIDIDDIIFNSLWDNEIKVKDLHELNKDIAFQLNIQPENICSIRTDDNEVVLYES